MKVKYYSPSELQKELEKESARVRRESIDIMLNLAAWAMWDILNAGESDIRNVLDAMSYKAGFVCDGSVSIDDIRKMLKDEADITINISGG